MNLVTKELPVLSAYQANSDLVFASLARLYLKQGCRVADVTYGRGFWWRQLRMGDYCLVKLDALKGDDATATGLSEQSLDAFVFDPPFLRDSLTSHSKIKRIRPNYNLDSALKLRSHEDLLRFYDRAAKEAARVLRPKGKFILKCQDEVASGRQRLTHVELLNRLNVHGFRVLDLFVQLQKSPPRTPRDGYCQKHARKNHSYYIVFERVMRLRIPPPIIWS